MTARRIDLTAMKRAARRTEDGMLMWLLILFQASAMLLLTFKTNPIDRQALAFAGIMPLVTLLMMKLAPKIWRVDRVLLAMILFSGMRGKLEGNTSIPACFQGVPITLVTAAFLSLGFMGFSGLV